MPTEAETILGYQAAVAAVRARLLQLSAAAWNGLGSYRDADIDRLVAMLVPRVQAGQIQVATLTAAYVAAIAGSAASGLVDRAAVTGGRGVPPEEVYRRPANQVYIALAEGKPFPAAVAAGLTRLVSIVATDLQMAKVRQSDASLRKAGTHYYRRVLTGGHNCAKCIIASTRRYEVGRLLPIHPGCDCGIAAVKDSAAPLVLDPKLLDATHEQVEAFAGIENANAEGYQDLIVTHEHGEMGPVLAWRGQKFTGPADI